MGAWSFIEPRLRRQLGINVSQWGNENEREGHIKLRKSDQGFFYCSYQKLLDHHMVHLLQELVKFTKWRQKCY